MFKKLTSRKLTLILGVFLLIILIDRILEASHGEGNIDMEMAEVDSAAVSRFIIHAPSDEHEEVVLTRESDGWVASKGNVKSAADVEIIKSMIKELTNLRPERLAANSNEKWKEFQVGDSMGTKMEVFEGEKKVLDLVIGKFSYQQHTQSGITYFRAEGEEEVYAAKSFLAMAFTQGFSGYRNKIILKDDVADWKKVEVGFPGDSSYIITSSTDGWQSDCEVADSAKVISYLNAISTTLGYEFDDDFNAEASAYVLKITGKEENMAVSAFPQSNGDYVIHSSENPASYFIDRGGNIFGKLFRSCKSLEADVPISE